MWLNGEPVKQVRTNRPDVPPGWYVPAVAARIVRLGVNVIKVSWCGPGKDRKSGAALSSTPPFIRLGLIDWRG